MPKIKEIARSFSKTFQEKQFEPFQVFASYKGELEGNETPEEVREFSEKLQALAEEDVRRITDMWTNRRAANIRRKEEKEVPFN
jgi:hypothetical protein